MEISLVYNCKNTLVLAYDYVKSQTIIYISGFKNSIYYMVSLLFIYLFMIIYLPFVYMIHTYIVFTLYWTGLGVLSTIGLGTGIHTGIFFLFPFIISIKDKALECGTTDFDIIGSNKFICESLTSPGSSSNDNLALFIKVLPPTILWGFGSSLGEIPPYYLAKMANDKKFVSNYAIIQKYYDQVLYFIDKYGFATIFILACWPNITFDMCGMASGYCGISITNFLLAAFMGKGLVKAPIEAYAILFVYDEDYIDYNGYDNYIKIFNGIFFITILYFLKAVIENMAERQYMTIKK
jgi:vacuole membrane protein 1